ncbi:hypothetical protein [Pedobacter sp.]
MARTKNIVDEHKLSHLKKMVETKFGRPITSSKDCNDLANYLANIQNEGNINPQTIRRLFGLVKTEHSPSLFTLNLLAKYTQNCAWANYQPQQEIDSNTNLLANLIIDFYADPLFGYNQIVDDICENDALQSLLLNRLATIPAAQGMFFENRPLRDCLNKSFKHALPIYLNSKGNTNEAKLFTYGMLFWSAFLTENRNDINLYFKLIEEMPLTNDIYNIPAARKFGVQLMYYHLTNNETEFIKWFEKTLDIRQENIHLTNFDWNFMNFDFVIIEHLLLIGKYDCCQEVWQLHQQDKQKYQRVKQEVQSFDQYRILIDAFCHKGYYKPVMQFDANATRLGERKFYTLLFIIYQLNHAQQKAHLKRQKLTKQLNNLITDTGYTWFYKLVN